MTADQDKPLNRLFSSTDEKEGSQRGVWVYKWLLMITGLFALIIVAGLAISLRYSTIEAIDQLIAYLELWLGYWRLFLFFIIFAGWNHWSIRYANWSSMNTEQFDRMVAYRWRMAAWVLVMEVLYSQNVLSHFFSQIVQTWG